MNKAARARHRLLAAFLPVTAALYVGAAADPAGYGLGVQQIFNPQTGTFWAYEGQAFGALVTHYYFPVAANSSATNDDLAGLTGAVYQTLHKAGAVHTR